MTHPSDSSPGLIPHPSDSSLIPPSDIALSVKNVSKCFEMYEKPVHRLYQTLCAGHRKFYKEFWALKDVSFDVHRGECVGIIGRNGAGKSTLLQVITGTLAPTTGTVETCGRIAALLELGSGFNPEFTGRENVYLNGAILGLSKEEIDKRYDDILSFADIGEFIDQPVKTYSSGMMVRLAFAVQVMVDPDILIVDEALAVGDARFQLKCFNRLKHLREIGTSILFVSHAVDQVRSMCDKSVLLEGGRPLYIGDAKEATLRYMQLLFPKSEEPAAAGGKVTGDSIGGTPETGSAGAKIRKETVPVSEVKSDFADRRQSGDGTYELRFIPDDVKAKKFGVGGSRIDEIHIWGLHEPNVFSGGEHVRAEVRYSWDREAIGQLALEKGLKHDLGMGFAVANSKGEYVFGINNFDFGTPVDYRKGSSATVRFSFVMPKVPRGTYFITLAIALGEQVNHIQTCWYDYLVPLESIPEGRLVFGQIAIDYEFTVLKMA